MAAAEALRDDAAARDARHAHADAHHDADHALRQRAARHAGARRRAGRERDRALEPCAMARRSSSCCRSARQIPTRIVMLPGAEAGVGALGVAASLLRHIPAESVLLAIHDATTPDRERASACGSCSTRARRRLPSTGSTCAPKCASAIPTTEVERELSIDPNSMLVLGLDSLADGRDGAAQRAARRTAPAARS